MRTPVLVTGTARSGTTLLARMLDARADTALASDPYLPLVRAIRDAALDAADLDADGPLPLEDYYGTPDRIARLDTVQSADLSALPVLPAARDSLVQSLVARATHEAPDLAARMDELRGDTWGAVLLDAFALVQRVRGTRDLVGFKDVWSIEIAAPLLALAPEARVIVVRRDPRAVVASLQALHARAGGPRGHVLSYARHWRKEAAFLARHAGDPRIVPVTYERLVANPVAEAERLCAALGVPGDAAMLDASRLRDALGAPWTANSSYADGPAGIATASVGRWREELDHATVSLVELVCGPEMEREGYSPGPLHLTAARDALVRDDAGPVDWRSDLGDVDADMAVEDERRAALAAGTVAPAALRPLFLFGEAFERLLSKEVPG